MGVRVTVIAAAASMIEFFDVHDFVVAIKVGSVVVAIDDRVNRFLINVVMGKFEFSNSRMIKTVNVTSSRTRIGLGFWEIEIISRNDLPATGKHSDEGSLGC